MGHRRTYSSRIASPDIHIADRVTRESKVAHARLPQGDSAPALMPLISRGLPAYDTASGLPGGSGTAATSVDAGYHTVNRFAVKPTAGAPQSWILDISGVPNAQKSAAVLHWFNLSLNYWDAVSAQNSINFSNEPRDYTVQGGTGAGGTLPNTNPEHASWGWSTLATVTGNVYADRRHSLNLTGYNWVRLKFTDCNGPTGNDDVAFQVNIHNAALGQEDSIIFLGDSIMQECMSWKNLDGSAWTNGPLTKLVEVALPGRYPLYVNGGVPTTASGYADTNKAALFAGFTGKYAALGWGANDASANVTKATYKANMLSVITYAIGTVGCLGVILPKVTQRQGNPTADALVVQYNAAIDELAAADPTHVKVGPDFYAAVNGGTIPLRDGLHPTFAGAGNGYEVMQGLWRDWLVANYY